MSELHRFADWEARLSVYLDRVTDEPFKWGKHDCALFAADCVKAMTGTDPAADFRGIYSDERGAALALREHGAGTLLKTVKSWLGEPTCIHHAKRGDIVMRDRTTTGVCVGQYSWFIGQDQGCERLLPVPTSDCRYAFTLPFALVAK